MQSTFDEISEETRLTKNDAAPPVALPIAPTASSSNQQQDEISEMTGSTRESKANRYAANVGREITKQYTGQISSMQSDINERDNKIAQLELQLKQLSSQKHDKGDDLDHDLSMSDNDHELEESDYDHTNEENEGKEDDPNENLPPSNPNKRRAGDVASDSSTISSKRTALSQESTRADQIPLPQSPSNKGDILP